MLSVAIYLVSDCVHDANSFDICNPRDIKFIERGNDMAASVAQYKLLPTE
jgi:hypothetical protein